MLDTNNRCGYKSLGQVGSGVRIVSPLILSTLLVLLEGLLYTKQAMGDINEDKNKTKELFACSEMRKTKVI